MKNLKKSMAVAALAVSATGIMGATSASAAVAPAPCAQGNHICATSARGGVFSINSGVDLGGSLNTSANWNQNRANYAASVKHIQAKVGVTQDGVFGPATRNAVMAFQRSHHLSADGVVGPATARAMGLYYDNRI